MDIPLLDDDSHLDLSPKANLYTWEEQLGDILMREHLVHWRNLSYEDATGGRGEVFSYILAVALGQATFGRGGL